MYLHLVLRETQKKNTVLGYLLTRLAPIPEDGDDQREDLIRMLRYIDPSIVLTGSSGESAESEMAKWYKETFGVPGTPEFEENIKRMNQELKNNDSK